MADLIERARAEVDLRRMMFGEDRTKWSRADRMTEELLCALEAAREDAVNMEIDVRLLRPDAERYRWVIGRHPLRFQRLITGSVVSGRVERKDLIDAAIDRAIVGEQQGDRKYG